MDFANNEADSMQQTQSLPNSTVKNSEERKKEGKINLESFLNLKQDTKDQFQPS